MKVLLVHNEYGKHSGEEAVVDKMAEIFKELDYQVAQLRMSTAGLRDSLSGKVRGFIAGIHSPAGIKAMKGALEHEKPDVVNVHNLYPFISPAALRECKKAGVPVVMTIHNFRLICPTGLFMRDHRPCELCLEKGNEWGCVKYNCEHSMLKSIGYAARSAIARVSGHFADCVDVFACITDFQRNKLKQAGFPEDKLVLIPNSMDVPDTGVAVSGNYVAYSGRISREKGVDLIIEAARRNPGIPFRLAGAVRDKDLVENLPDNVTLTGFLSGDELADFYRNARFFVMASRWYEGFPVSILEAGAYSKPMIGPAHGGFVEILGDGEDAAGILTPPGDADTLSKAIDSLWNDEPLSKKLGDNALRKLRDKYSTPVITQQWKTLLENIKR